MSSAADFIQALQRRLRLTQFRSRPGEFPPGWQAWFDGMRARSGAVTGAGVDAIIAVFLQRPLAVPPQRALALNRWQAFSTLWRQEWQPPAREERWLRALAAAVSGLVHLAFAVLLLWLGIVQLVATSAPPRGDETVVTVQYIGTGAEQAGGGPIPEVEPRPEEPAPAQAVPTEAAQAPQPGAAPSATAEPRPEPPPGLPRLPDIAVRTETPRLQAVPPEVVQREIPEPTVAEQPLVVSKPVPDRSRFMLQAPAIQVPEPAVAVATPDLQLPQPPMQVTEAPPAPPEFRPEFRPDLPPVRVEQPALRSDVPQLAVREVATPLPRIALPEAAPVDSVPELQPQVSQVRERRIPTPAAPAPQPAPTPAPAAEAVATREAPAPAELPAPAAKPATPVASTPSPTPSDAATGAGPEPVPAPGGWPTPTADDSWDLAENGEPGPEAGQPDGVFDSEGRVQLAETPGPGSASLGLPPGTVTQEIAHLDRAGTWLRRPPIDYEPTAFAEYWRPNETLIAEWVRKSIMTIRIPIPGTSKSLVCKTVLLAVGGACNIFDPNLNEQPATARPPPDVPFKPELQQSSGSVPPAG